LPVLIASYFKFKLQKHFMIFTSSPNWCMPMPRRRTDAREFERHCDHTSVLLEAGRLWNGVILGGGTVALRHAPPPPRLVMVHISSEAIRTKSRSVEIGDSTREFLTALGMQPNGGERGGYTIFRKQMEALAACRLTIGMQAGVLSGTILSPLVLPFFAIL
jgi:hypothetical protein